MTKEPRKPLIVYVPTANIYLGREMDFEEKVEYAKELIYRRLTGQQLAGSLFMTESKLLKKNYSGGYYYPEYLIVNLEDNTCTLVTL